MQQVHLSKADSKVLAQVFDPESGPAKAEILVDPDLPADRHILELDLLQDLRARENKAIQLIEGFERFANPTVQSKLEAYRSALSILDDLIEEFPKYASARNNRAQLRRWRYGDRNLLVQTLSTMNPDTYTAVSDLRRCISLASPSRPTEPVSPAQGKLLSNAHTQFGAILLAASREMGEGEDVEVTCDGFQGWSQDDFEEEASRVFFLGGLYGNETAKALAVHTNPHAKMCGNIVQEAMRKEMAQAS